METSQHSLLAACFTLHSINATLAIVPHRGAGLWIWSDVCTASSITVKPVLNGLFIKRNFVLNGSIFRSRDYHSIPWLNGNLAWAEKCSGPLRSRLRQVLLYIKFIIIIVTVFTIYVFVEYLTTSVALTIWRQMVGWLVNDELERTLKEAVEAEFEVLSRHLTGCGLEIHEHLTGNPFSGPTLEFGSFQIRNRNANRSTKTVRCCCCYDH
jgi:hypothetical protein